MDEDTAKKAGLSGGLLLVLGGIASQCMAGNSLLGQWEIRVIPSGILGQKICCDNNKNVYIISNN